MKTLNDIIQGISLTSQETAVLGYLNNELSGNFGEKFSHVDCGDIAAELKQPVATAKGIVGSLVKKGILEMWESESGYHVVNFTEQKNMTK